MKICVYGAGGVGGVIAAHLKKSNFDISIIARGEHLRAIKTHGLKIIDKERKEEIFTLPATDKPEELGAQDFVILCVKGHDVLNAAQNMKPLLGKDTNIVAVMNGIPWWYLSEISGQPSVISRFIDAERIIAGVIYISTGIASPGVIDYMGGRRLMFGEPSGKITTRLKHLTDIFEKAGMRPIQTPDIKKEIWLKLWGNITFNPLSVITKMGMAEIAENPETRERAKNIMLEMKNVTDKLGIDLGMSVDERLEEGRKSGNHKTSMLQDFESGKKLELDGIIGAVIEIAALINIPVPAIKNLYEEIINYAN